MSDSVAGESLWLETASTGAPRSRLEGEFAYDVVVLGAGITGLTAALLLRTCNKTDLGGMLAGS